MRLLIYFLLFIFIPCFSIGQPVEWKYISTAEFIGSIAQEDNYLWIANYAGITRFDTITHQKTYYNSTNTPFRSNMMKLVATDHHHNKWFAPWEMQLYRMSSSGSWLVFDTSNSPIRNA